MECNGYPIVSTPYTSLAGYTGSETDISKANTKPNSPAERVIEVDFKRTAH